MQVRILGSAAGGGVPQWNCRCPNCLAARAGAPEVRRRTQSSVAVSADGRRWFLLNVSPDVRQQIIDFSPLTTSDAADPPARGPTRRGTAIAGCVLTDAELDHASGLLLLREGNGFPIHATATVRRWLNRFLPIEPILASFSNPLWIELPLDRAVDLCLSDQRPSGLRVRAIEMGGHAPRFVRAEAASASGGVIGLEIKDCRTGGLLVYAPCAATLAPLENAARTADAILLDGTFWSDDEPLRAGIGQRTARQMGHLPVQGAASTLEWLAKQKAQFRFYVHVNNTNPMLNERGPEHREVTHHGVRIAADGDSFEV
jgi:pyrroloquinoline quinone biosynthesis protein B